YKCYHPPTRKLYVLDDVTFVENKPYFSTPYIPEELPIIVDFDIDPSLDISSSRDIAPHERPLNDNVYQSTILLLVEETENDGRLIYRFRFDKVYIRKKDAIPASATKINHLYRVTNP
ncbi:unnamed protein product, partial [Dovyalis caffra]